MAEKLELQQETEAPAGQTERRKHIKMVGILFGVMAIEALVVVVLVKSYGPGPEQANAMVEGLDGTQGVPAEKDVEVPIIATLRAPNEKASLTIYELTIVAVVSDKNSEECAKLVEERSNKIQDRLSTVVRESDPRDFSGGMEAVRGKIKNELAKVLESEDMIKEILIPKAVPFSAN